MTIKVDNNGRISYVYSTRAVARCKEPPEPKAGIARGTEKWTTERKLKKGRENGKKWKKNGRDWNFENFKTAMEIQNDWNFRRDHNSTFHGFLPWISSMDFLDFNQFPQTLHQHGPISPISGSQGASEERDGERLRKA